MKKYILYLILLLLNFFCAYTQGIVNDSELKTHEAIQQIGTPGMDDILSFQTLNQGISNFVLSQQMGNHNTANINQHNEAGSSLSNQSYSVQSGNSNDMTIGQIGSGNLLLGFQLGYLTILSGSQQESLLVLDNVLTSVYPVEGERNKMSISQNGNSNGVMAVQQGSDNTLSADQSGNNNYLLILQKGTNNSIQDYKQENNSGDILVETIIQIGDKLSLETVEASSSKAMGNTFMQTGSNLEIEVNNGLLNSVGGVEITQTGRDMKVVIDQLFFSFPMR